MGGLYEVSITNPCASGECVVVTSYAETIAKAINMVACEFFRKIHIGSRHEEQDVD